jgi:hypothetical protein
LDIRNFSVASQSRDKECSMNTTIISEEVHPEDFLVEPTIKIESQETVTGAIRIEARPTGRKKLRGTISISIKESGATASAHFLPRHARELATTLLAVADKAEQFPAPEDAPK